MISGIAFTKIVIVAASESPLSLKTSTLTSNTPALSKRWLITPCFVVFVSPSPKFHLYSSIIVGSGVVEERASKFTDSPEFIVSLSDVRDAFGLPGPMPPQPARDYVSISRIKSAEAFRPPCPMGRESQAPSYGCWALGRRVVVW
jgi:hypothetical protein